MNLRGKIFTPALLAVAGIAVILPPFVSRGFDISNILQINVFLLVHSIRGQFQEAFPYFNFLSLVLFFCLLASGRLFGRVFSLFAGFLYLLGGILQNLSVSDQYGFAVCTSTLVLTLLTACSWFWGFLVRKDDFQRASVIRILFLAPPALLALWWPVNPSSTLPDFNLCYFLASGSSLTFCMLTTVSLAALLIYFPHVNLLSLRVTSLCGLLIGIGNLWLEFLSLPELFWIGVLHIPLVVLSGIGVFLSFGKSLRMGRDACGAEGSITG